MTDLGTVIYPGTIRFERLLPGSPSRIWEYLTVPAMLATWLAEAKIDLRAGGQIELEFDVEEVPARKKNGGGIVTGVISRCAPPRLLSYSWMDSAVTFEVKANDKEVQLVLTHSGLGEPLVHKCCAGWHTHLDILLARLRGEKPKAFLPLFEGLLKQYKQQVSRNMQKERRHKTASTGGVRKDRRRSPRGSDFV